MNAISALLERAKAPRIVERITIARRVRPIDASSAPGFVLCEEDGWVFWLGDDRIDHVSRADYLEPST